MLRPPASDPRAPHASLSEAGWRRLAAGVWAGLALVIVGGTVVMALTWRDAGLPRLDSLAPDGFSLNQIRIPEIRRPEVPALVVREREGDGTASNSAPDGLVVVRDRPDPVAVGHAEGKPSATPDPAAP